MRKKGSGRNGAKLRGGIVGFLVAFGARDAHEVARRLKRGFGRVLLVSLLKPRGSKKGGGKTDLFGSA